MHEMNTYVIKTWSVPWLILMASSSSLANLNKNNFFATYPQIVDHYHPQQANKTKEDDS